jgi:hypothetical protein
MSFTNLLNDTCNIYEQAATQDENTGEEILTAALIAENVPCAFQNESGGVNRDRLQTGVNRDRLFILPQEFTFKKRFHVVEVRGNRYNINSITDLGGRKKYLELGLELISIED